MANMWWSPAIHKHYLEKRKAFHQFSIDSLNQVKGFFPTQLVIGTKWQVVGNMLLFSMLTILSIIHHRRGLQRKIREKN